MAVEAMWMTEKLTYQDVDKLCKRHLANRGRIELAGATVVRYEAQETQRFKPAHPHVSALLLERIDFDRAFRKLSKREQKVLMAWYGYERKVSIGELMETWECSKRTILRRRTDALKALAEVMNG